MRYATALQELRTGNYDVVHVHEPLAPVSPWLITDRTPLPLVGTFHTYNENRISNGIATALGARRMLNRLHVRIAVSEAAAWTARRFFGGHYRIIPNGVHVDAERAALGALRPQTDKLKIVFVGQAVERKGLPLLLRAFEALREHIPTELTVIGPSEQELSPLMLDMRDVRVLGKVDDETKCTELEAERRAVRPVARRRELRHGPDRGVRGGHAGGRLGHRRLSRRRARRGRRGARAARRRAGAGRGAARSLRGARPPRPDGARRRARRRAVRVAARRRPGDGRLRGRDRRTRAGDHAAAGRGPSRRPRRRPEAARPGPAAGEPRAAADRPAEAQQGARRRAPRRPRHRVDRRRRARVPRAPEDRLDQHRQGADHREPDAGPARPRDHVQRDGDARLLVARDPESRACLAPASGWPTPPRERSSAC